MSDKWAEVMDAVEAEEQQSGDRQSMVGLVLSGMNLPLSTQAYRVPDKADATKTVKQVSAEEAQEETINRRVDMAIRYADNALAKLRGNL